MQYIENYIDGQLQAAQSQQTIDNIDPATATIYSTLPSSDENDLNSAINAAEQSYSDWSCSSAEYRAQILCNIADLIEQQLDELALAESIDNGKPLSLAKAIDIPRAAANFRFFAQAITQFSSEAHSMGDSAINYTLRQPLGIVACISPWNLPLYLFTWKIAPALAAGNCVIAKPSEVTPMTAYLLSKICIAAGLPKGVLNILHGYGHTIGELLVKHPTIKAISFTGGTKTGAHIASNAAPQFKKLSLELGGKNATLVFADCDWEKTLTEVVRSAFANQGQICLCGSRILIEQSIYEKFKIAFVEKTKQLVIGDPQNEDTQQGAIVSQAHYEKILNAIELVKQEGGNILCGGNAAQLSGRCEKGYFIEPTVIEGLSADCRTNQEEIFGPVVTLIPFNNDTEAVNIANNTPYGLATSIWSQDITRCHKLAQQIDTGIIWINSWLLRDLRTPFGGMKQSGVGREGGLEALRFFTEAKNVCVKL